MISGMSPLEAVYNLTKGKLVFIGCLCAYHSALSCVCTKTNTNIWDRDAIGARDQIYNINININTDTYLV